MFFFSTNKEQIYKLLNIYEMCLRNNASERNFVMRRGRNFRGKTKSPVVETATGLEIPVIRCSETINDTDHKAGDIDLLIDTEGAYGHIDVRIGVIVGKRLEV